MKPRDRLTLPELPISDLRSLAVQFLGVMKRRLPVFILLSAIVAKPYSFWGERYPFFPKIPDDPGYVFDPQPIVWPLMFGGGRVLIMLGFGCLFVLAVTCSLATWTDLRTQVRATVIAAIRVFLFGLLAFALALLGLAGLGIGLQLLFMTVIMLIAPLSIVVFPMALLASGFVLVRFWPFPVVLAADESWRPIKRSWELTRRREVETLVAFLSSAAVVWPVRALVGLAEGYCPPVIPQDLLHAFFDLLLMWCPLTVLGVLMYVWFRHERPEA